MNLASKAVKAKTQITPKDFDDVESGATFPVILNSFNYFKDYAFGSFEIEGEGVLRVILGATTQFPINVLLPLKGSKMILQYRGISPEGYIRANIQF